MMNREVVVPAALVQISVSGDLLEEINKAIDNNDNLSTAKPKMSVAQFDEVYSL